MLIQSVSALLLISDDAPALAKFYREALELPLVDEIHDGTPLHYGCEIGPVHFAIHPSEGWPGSASREHQSPIIALSTGDVAAVCARLRDWGLVVPDPFDHGFAHTVSFRDPDGNTVEILQFKGGAG